jgi:hypothetical protein
MLAAWRGVGTEDAIHVYQLSFAQMVLHGAYGWLSNVSRSRMFMMSSVGLEASST